MSLVVWEVKEMLGFSDFEEHGLFINEELAKETAELIAEEKGYPKIDDQFWGEKDHYGPLRGVWYRKCIVKEKVEY